MPHYTNKPMLAADFIESCIDYEDNALLRTVNIRGVRSYGSDSYWTLERDNAAMSTWRTNVDNQAHEIRWLYPYLVDAREGRARRFKSLGAAHREAERMAIAARANLEFRTSTRFYPDEHPIAT